MSCVTCEITPPAGHGGPMRIHPTRHVGHRLGDTIPGDAVILFRGQDWSLQTVEAYAGDETTGWVEVRIINGDGAPTIHRAGPLVCPGCAGPREPAETVDGWPDPASTGVTRWPVCPGCGNSDRPTLTHPAHVVTTIRWGDVTIVRGTDVETGAEG